MPIRRAVRNVVQNRDAFTEVARSGNLRVMRTLAGPALRGMVLQRGREGEGTTMPTAYGAHYDWGYAHDHPALAHLAMQARKGQWDPDTALDWGTTVDPYDPVNELVDESMSPLGELAAYQRLTDKEKRTQRAALLAWMLSQFLHGEQGALFVACQVTECVHWMDGKLYGSTQVMDEGRHVYVFDRYLSDKLEKRYTVNDNLYVILDALMSDRRWDIKFLGMQILVEGLALGAFGTLRASTKEPLLRDLLRYVISDEARHVHFGVLALQEHYGGEIGGNELREREDWAYEMCVLLRNRFLAHEYWEEHWAHTLSRTAWTKFVLESNYMERFRRTMFKRIVPNLKRIHLLSARMRPHYERLGLLQFESGKAAPELTAEEVVAEG